LRGILAVLLTLAVAPAVAEDWRRYDNAAFGYAIELPVPFEIVEENEARLVLRDGPRTLEVFGLDLAPLDLGSGESRHRLERGRRLCRHGPRGDVSLGTVDGHQRRVAACSGTGAAVRLGVGRL
jgi:hypothetical protein